MTGEANLNAAGPGRFELIGRLDFDTVPAVLARSRSLFDGTGMITVDLAGVEHSNSAGLGLLLEWMRLAGEQGSRIEFLNIPDGIQAVAHTSDLDSLLPLEG